MKFKDVRLFRAPSGYRSGDDAFNEKFASALSNTLGLKVSIEDLWPDVRARKTYRWANIKGANKFRKFGPILCGCYMSYRSLNEDDVAVVRGEFWPSDEGALFEKKLRNKRIPYIYNLIDNWLEADSLSLRKRAQIRCELASAIVVPTNYLQEVVLSLFPRKKVAVIEEPIDVSRFRFSSITKSEQPSIIWCGNPGNISEVLRLAPILEQIYTKKKFDLFLLSGREIPEINLGIPWQWVPHSSENEIYHSSRAWLGFSCLEDNKYSRAKGSYKIKTYMASGTHPIATHVGHVAQLLEGTCVGDLIKVGDWNSWERLILERLSNPEQTFALGIDSQKLAGELFDYGRVAGKWAEVIKSIL